MTKCERKDGICCGDCSKYARRTNKCSKNAAHPIHQFALLVFVVLAILPAFMNVNVEIFELTAQCPNTRAFLFFSQCDLLIVLGVLPKVGIDICSQQLNT